jgi:hypothetical protein
MVGSSIAAAVDDELKLDSAAVVKTNLAVRRWHSLTAVVCDSHP